MGQRRTASATLISSTSRPQVRAIDAPRRSSSIRASLVAIESDPFCLKPVSCPVSAARVWNRSALYFASWVRL